MKIRWALFSAAILIGFLPSQVTSEEAVLGQGNISCGSWIENRRDDNRAPRKIGPARRTPQNCPRMIPFRSRSDSLMFAPRLSAIGSESNFSRSS